MNQRVIYVVVMSLSLSFTSCTIDDECLDPDIVAKFEQEKATMFRLNVDLIDRLKQCSSQWNNEKSAIQVIYAYG